MTRVSLPLEDFNVFAFTETNLTKSFLSSELGLVKYSIYRCDRNLANTKKKSGGGVLLAVSDRFSSSPLSQSSQGFEQLFVRISISSHGGSRGHFIIGLVYIPPASPGSFFSSHFDEVERLRGLYPDDSFIILGDFNLPELTWNDDQQDCSTPRSGLFMDLISYHELDQLSRIRNGRGRILDLVLFSRGLSGSVVKCDSFLPCDENHHPLSCSVHLQVFEELEEEFVGFNFRKAPYSLINSVFSGLYWPSILHSDDIDNNVATFNEIISNILKVFVPPFTLKNDSFPFWYTSFLKSLIFQKKFFHKLYKTSSNPYFYQRFSLLRSQCKEVSSACYSSYLDSVSRNIHDDPHYFWRYVKNLRGTSGLPKVLKHNGIESFSSLSSANLFVQHFSSAFLDVPLCSNYGSFDSSDNFSSCRLSQVDISKKLSTLCPRKGMGPDGIPPLFLKNCSLSLSFPLFLLFNQSLALGVFPSAWKQCFITPVPKKDGPRNLVCNYRPIAILSCIPKIFECLVLKSLLPQLTPLIIPNQHGFMPGKSVVTNLLEYLNFISHHMSGPSQVDAIYLDLTKAFDRVNHRLLIDKLVSFGFNGTLLSWFSSYLSNRSCMVRVGSSISDSFLATSGVPQGSHLGPILFLLFINDVRSCLMSHDVKFLLFCDDLKIFRQINCEHDSLILQQALSSLKQWFDCNLLEVNPSKCNAITFSRSQRPQAFTYFLETTPVPRSQLVRDLGVFFDVKLSFNEHMDLICRRASSMLGFVTRSTKDLRDPLSFKILYCSLVRSILEFASCIWNPSYNYYSGRIERIQHHALKTLGRKMGLPNASYSNLGSSSNLLPLSARREMYDLISFINILQSKFDSPSLLQSINIHIPTRVTRNPLPFKPPFVRTNYLQNSPIIRFQRSANRLANSIESIDFFNSSNLFIKDLFSRAE